MEEIERLNRIIEKQKEALELAKEQIEHLAYFIDSIDSNITKVSKEVAISTIENALSYDGKA